MNHTIEHVFDVSAERLWDVYFFDEAFGRALQERLRLRFSGMELQHEGAGPSLIVRRRLQMTARRELPGLLHRMLGDSVTLWETGDFNAERRRYSVKIEPAVRGARIECSGEYTWDTLPGGQLRRVWEGRCEARIPLVGARIERHLLDEIEASLAELYAFTRRWLREHPEPTRVDRDVRGPAGP